MRYAGLKKNDVVDCDSGICVSLWTQGCPHHCYGCHNPNTWSFDGGYEVPTDIRGQIIKAINDNGIKRDFSVLGGEPLCSENVEFVDDIVSGVRTAYPDIKIYLWSGYTIEELQEKRNKDTHLDNILKNIDILIEGRYKDELRDITLKLRGSPNQRILYQGKDF